MAKLATLIDDFEDGVINSSLWDVLGTVNESGGRAVLTPISGFSFLTTDVQYDLTASQVIMHVPTVTAAGISGTLLSGVSLEMNSSNSASIFKFGNDIICQKIVAGVTTNVLSTPYNPATHVYWRFREAAGIFYWEVSAAGTSWTSLFSTTVATNLFPVTAVYLTFAAGYTSGFELSPGMLEIAAVNPGLSITGNTAVSTSSGTANISSLLALTGSASSTSSGTAAISIPPLGAHSVTGAAISTTTTSASIIIVAPNELTGAALSTTFGTADISITGDLSGVVTAFTSTTAVITIIPAAVDPSTPVQYFTFEPPVAYDLPPTLPNPRPRYINAHAKWKPGQRRGRSVLKSGSTYTIVDSPTVDQTNSADAHYLGGHIYTVTQEEANSLSAAGFAVTPFPDRIFPILTILSPPSGANVDQRVRVKLLVSEQVEVTATLTGVGLTYPIAVPSTNFSITTSDLLPGSYRLEFVATDLALLSTTAYVDFEINHGGQPVHLCVFPATDLYPSDDLYPILCDEPTPVILPIPSTTLLPSVTLLPGTP